ncbi:hypothetical protein [Pseudooceanicola sp. LIPI14-2-Ac024]|uniref:hypothetical protein n=1 Tax=Pseudooceanicola sp. LIPI14-2-Ac024 TaxID=3344875 RepID=UPI0035CF5E65
MFGNVIYSAKVTAQKAAISMGGVILLLIGLAFLTSAAWIALSEARSTLFAATVIGCAYFGLGLILLAVASMRRPVPPPAPAAVAADPASQVTLTLGTLTGAFVQGLGAGIAARSAAPRRPTPPPPPPPAE